MFKFLVLLGLIGATVAHSVVYTAAPTVPVTAYTSSSTVVKSDRVGGNFAYSVHQNPAVVATYTHGTPYQYQYGVPATATAYQYGTVPVVQQTPTVYNYKTTAAGVAAPVYYTNTHNNVVGYPYNYNTYNTVPAATHFLG